MLTITYLGHASFLIKNDDFSLVIDPYEDNSVPGLRMPRVEANYVFCSHGHSDHNAIHLVKLLPTDNKVDYEVINVFHDHHNGAKRGLNNMHLFNIDGYRILHTGDLGHIPSEDVIKKIKGVDIMLAPINGFFTISADELCQIVKMVEPKLVIPMHYYKKEENSGYPDGGQIDIFLKLMKDYYLCENATIKVDDNLFKNKVLVFKKSLGRTY